MLRNTVLFAALTTLLTGCGQNQPGKSSGPGADTLTCLIPGYDSIIYYMASHGDTQQIKRGLITDTGFTKEMFQKAKAQNLVVVFRPLPGGDMIPNFREMIRLSDKYEIANRFVDTAEFDEARTPGFTSAPYVKALMRGESPPPFKLDLPRAEPDSPNAVAKFPTSSRLTILLGDDRHIYGYMGTDIRSGKKYTYDELKDALMAKRRDNAFSVQIRPSKNSTYKGTVDMLDLMKTAAIKNYTLVEITDNEENFLDHEDW
ncbi:MAG TPA: biopolymer transporter ExbD [Puia sp.]|nr:biopolymer transporter ExbD [Puia sp.]